MQDDPVEWSPGGERPSPELLLTAACCRPLASPARVAAIAAAARRRIDPATLLQTVRHHRVEGFVSEGLARAGVVLPADAAQSLRERAATARLTSLRNAGEELRLSAAMRAAGVDAILLKGSTVAMLAHGSLGVKTSWDVDLFVARAQADAARRVMGAEGYVLDLLDGVTDERQIARFMAGNKETMWRHPGRGLFVELHTAFSDIPSALRGVGMASPRQQVKIADGAAVPTLADAPLFAYLAAHGTGHGWARLKWLADVAALLDRDPDRIEALHDEAVALGAGRCPGVALLLAARILGTPVPPALLVRIERDRGVVRLAAMSLRMIVRPRSDTDRLASTFGETLALYDAQTRYLPGVRYRLAALWALLGHTYNPAQLAVPRWALRGFMLGWLPVRLLSRTWRREAGG